MRRATLPWTSPRRDLPVPQLTPPPVQPPFPPPPPPQYLLHTPPSERWSNNRYCDILLLLLCMIDMMLFNLWRFLMCMYMIYPDHENSVTFLHVLCGLLLLLSWRMFEPSIWKRTPPLLGVLARCYSQLTTRSPAARRGPPVRPFRRAGRLFRPLAVLHPRTRACVPGEVGSQRRSSERQPQKTNSMQQVSF